MRLSRIGTSLALAGLYIVLRFIAPWIGSVFPNVLAVGFLYIALLMLAQLAFIVSIARLQLSLKHSALLILPTAIIVVAFTFLESNLAAQEMMSGTALVAVSSLRNLSLMLAAGMFGYTVSFIVREPNIILPAAVFAGFVDFWSVTWGPLSYVLEHQPAVLEKVTVQMPAAVAVLPGTMIGMGDFVFLSLFFGVLYRFAMNVKGAFWLGYVLLTLSMFLVLGFQGALPALVPIAIAVIATNLRHLKLRREELLATLYIGVVLLVLLVASGVVLSGR